MTTKTRKKTSKKDNRLCVVSSTGALCYGNVSGNRGDKSVDGKIRTYNPDALDSRIIPLPRAKTLYQVALTILGQGRFDGPHICPVAYVQKITGWKEKDFAPVLN